MLLRITNVESQIFTWCLQTITEKQLWLSIDCNTTSLHKWNRPHPSTKLISTLDSLRSIAFVQVKLKWILRCKIIWSCNVMATILSQTFPFTNLLRDQVRLAKLNTWSNRQCWSANIAFIWKILQIQLSVFFPFT